MRVADARRPLQLDIGPPSILNPSYREPQHWPRRRPPRKEQGEDHIGKSRAKTTQERAGRAASPQDLPP
eukprot:364615-Chlamydomonas_euryale.AAC.5